MPTSSRGQQIYGAIFFSAGALLCLWIAVSSVIGIIEANNAVTWPTTAGVVLSSKAQKGCGKGASFFPSVHYRYTISSQQYEGRRIAFGNCGCGSEGSAAVVAGQYPEGSAVVVHFNPSAPSEAVLMIGAVLDETWLGVFITGIMFFVSSALAYVFIKQATANPAVHTDLARKAAQGR